MAEEQEPVPVGSSAASEAARQMGRIRSEKKTIAARLNASRPRPQRRGVAPSEETRQKMAEGVRAAWERKKAAGETFAVGRAPKPIEEFPCNCGGEGLDHKTSCPRGRAIRRRQQAGQL